MRKIVYVVIVFLFAFGCKKEVNVPESFDYGKIENNTYKNMFFQFSFPVKSDWYVLDNEENERLHKLGTEIATGENEKLRKSLEASDINLAKLFTAFREAPGTNVAFNPSIIVNAENLKNAFGVKTNEDYLEVSKKLLLQTAMQINFIEEKKSIKIGSQDFVYVRLENTFNEIVVTQDYYITTKNNFALIFILSYVDDTGKNEVYEMFDKLKI
ncbi:hypothetical protein [Hyunsoonleella ulvae]|uniref:hypothetical protein n=1 Tax=Hyunsoonleella ulvae TaxID=2799948 RepID=UPI00193A4647|nr:hypothetical protein [Hyunsoonleella ulvae]